MTVEASICASTIRRVEGVCFEQIEIDACIEMIAFAGEDGDGSIVVSSRYAFGNLM